MSHQQNGKEPALMGINSLHTTSDGQIPRLTGWREFAQSLTESLPSFLTWRNGTDLPRSAFEIRERGTLARLSLWAKTAGSKILDVYMQLPKPGQNRLLHAPHFLFLLRSTNSPGFEQLHNYYTFVEAEEYLSGKRDRPPAGNWTALGDRYFPSEDSQPSSSEMTNPLLSGAVSIAPFARGILVDAWSPYLKDCWTGLYELGEIERYNLEEVEHIRQCLESSLDYIESVSPTVIDTIRSSVQVIGVIKSSMNSTAVSSMSVRRALGSLILANLLAGSWRPDDVCDAIVHETIHSIIYQLELLNPLLKDGSSSASVQVQSPWSGRSLDLYSFTHACFVWFGLWNFWVMHSHSMPEATALGDKAERGFLRGSLSALRTPELRDRLQPSVLRAIEEMFEYVRSNSHHQGDQRIVS